MAKNDKRRIILLIILAFVSVAWLVDRYWPTGDYLLAPDQRARRDRLLSFDWTGEKKNEVFVYICGAVNKPSVLKLPAGSRLVDGINAAGGLAPGADISRLNLAAVLKDQEQVVVPGQLVIQTAPSDGGRGESERVNINTASEAELDKLPGIGPATAQKIVAYRKANGNFKSTEELKKVGGIGDSKFNALKDKITI
ncbi:MAG: ComEA family DNA-binding protein [Negativicutes bacterium]|nr:ComEA family DNA-binding protein [Negativicutes bacterium]